MQFLNQHTSKYQKRSKHFVCTRLPGMPPVPPDYLAVLEREPRTVIHVKRAKMFDPMG